MALAFNCGRVALVLYRRRAFTTKVLRSRFSNSYDFLPKDIPLLLEVLYEGNKRACRMRSAGDEESARNLEKGSASLMPVINRLLDTETKVNSVAYPTKRED